MNKLKTLGSLIGLSALLLVACAGDDAGADEESQGQEQYEIQWGHSSAESEPMHVAAESVAEAVEERTDGQVTIDVFPNEQLGTLPELHEQAAAGAAIIHDTNPGFASEYGVPEIGILQAPYAFSTTDDLLAFVETDLMDEWTSTIRDNGLHSLSWNWYFGQRHVMGQEPYSSPEEIQGVPVRVSGNPVQHGLFNALGATPVQLGRAEIYTALQQGVVNATDGPFAQLLGDSIYEVADVVTLTGHVDMLLGVMISAEYFDSLPADLQEILAEEVAKGGEMFSELSRESEEEDRSALEDEGVTFSEADRDAYMDATVSFYDGSVNDAWTEDLLNQVREAQ